MFDALREHLDDEAIIEFTYITMMYTMHAVMSVALRLEFDDRDDPIVEIAAPEGVRGGQPRPPDQRRDDDEARVSDRARSAHGRAGARARQLHRRARSRGSSSATTAPTSSRSSRRATATRCAAGASRRDGDSLWWPAIGRNKRSVALDLRRSARAQLVRDLAAQCDVVLENFRPGVLDKWGLGYDALSAVNPALVLVHISGFGQTGPLAGQAGFGSVGEAMGGIRHTTGSPDRPPSRAGISLGDALASVFARHRHAVGARRRRGRPASARRSTSRSTRRSPR